MRLLLLSLVVLLALTGCVAGPTPHPIQQEGAEADGPTPDPSVPNTDGTLSESDASPSSGADGAFDSSDIASELDGDMELDTTTDTATDVGPDTATDTASDAAPLTGDVSADAATLDATGPD